MKVCAVIVAAYQATEWIAECLASIGSQEPLEGWRYETRIGVDGCEKTSRTLTAPHWFSPTNVGPYRIRNALIASSSADAYAVFDADDVMGPRYLPELLAIMGDGISGSARVGLDAKGQKGTNVYPWVCGVSVFSAAAMKRLGAYRPWRIVADYDAILRARRLKIPIARHESPLYCRRSHPNQLTELPGTKAGSPERKRWKREAIRLCAAHALYVKPEPSVQAPLVWRVRRHVA